MEEWRDIESAPKGVGILFGYFGDEPAVRGTMMVSHIPADIEPRLFAGWPYVIPPTHWHPLPKPPVV